MGISKLIDCMYAFLYSIDFDNFRENIAFDYSDLQITLRSMTGSDEDPLSAGKVEHALQSTYENSVSCEEVFYVIRERLNSKRSTNLNLIKVRFIFNNNVIFILCRLYQF